MKDYGAPASLAVSAAQRARTVTQEEFTTSIDTFERHLHHMVKLIEAGKDFDPQWMTVGRTHIQIGLMCMRRAVTRKDFF